MSGIWLSASKAARPSRVINSVRQTSVSRYSSYSDDRPFQNRSYLNNKGDRYGQERDAGNLGRDSFITARRTHEQELRNFNELLMLANQRSIQNSRSLVDIQKALQIYNSLKSLTVFTPSDVGHLIQSINASSRINTKSQMRSKVISLVRKEAGAQQKSLLLDCVEIIGNDLLKGVVRTSSFGLMQFFACFQTMKEPVRGLRWVEKIEESKHRALISMLQTGRVSAAIVSLMLQGGSSLETIEGRYQKTFEKGAPGINMDSIMCTAYLMHQQNGEALKLFKAMLNDYGTVVENDQYFSRAHDSFIGDCHDISVAKQFFQEAVTGKAPYPCQMHPSCTHRLMERCWKQNQDLSELISIWSSYLSVALNRREREYNIIHYSLLTHFMEKYPESNSAGYEQLKTIIATYAKRMPQMGMLFLNSLLTQIAKWHDYGVCREIVDSYQIYGVPYGFDTIRIILNAYEDLPQVQFSEISQFWQQRLHLQQPLEAFDFFSLAKACNREDPQFTKFFVDEFVDWIENGVEPSQARAFQARVHSFVVASGNGLGFIQKSLGWEDDSASRVQSVLDEMTTPAEDTDAVKETVIAEETPAEKVLTEESPVEETSSEEAPVEKTNIEEPVIAEETLAEEASTEESPVEETCSGEVPVEKTNIEEPVIADETLPEENSVEDSRIEVSSEETSSDETLNVETSSDESTSTQTSIDEITPAEEPNKDSESTKW